MFILHCIISIAIFIFIQFNNLSKSQEESSHLGKAWYVKEGNSIKLPCYSDIDDQKYSLKYKGGVFEWTYKIGNQPVLDFKKILYGNGTMMLMNLTRFESTTYRCTAEKMDGSDKKEFSHSVVVYGMAQFFLVHPFIYTVPVCDVHVNAKHNDLMTRLCYNWGNNREACPFSARMECYSILGKQGPESRRLRIHIEQRMEAGFVIPDCDAKCIKKAVVNHFFITGDKIVKEIVDKESLKSSDIRFKDFAFDNEGLMHRSIGIRCANGHQLYLQVLCVPCFPGSHVLQEGRFSYSNQPSECQLCDYGFYQELFAMEICYKCPKFGVTLKRGSVSKLDCTGRQTSPIGIYLVAGCILIIGFTISAGCLTKFGISILKLRNKQKLESVGLELRGDQLSPTQIQQDVFQTNPNNINYSRCSNPFLDQYDIGCSSSKCSLESSCLIEGFEDDVEDEGFDQHKYN